MIQTTVSIDPQSIIFDVTKELFSIQGNLAIYILFIRNFPYPTWKILIKYLNKEIIYEINEKQIETTSPKRIAQHIFRYLEKR